MRCRIGSELFVRRRGERPPAGRALHHRRGPEIQYLVSVIDYTAGLADPDETAAAGIPEAESRALDAFNDRLAEGHWVFAGGLTAPGAATVIDNRGGKALVTDGPFVETGVAPVLAAHGNACEATRPRGRLCSCTSGSLD